VVDILDIRSELYTEIFSLKSVAVSETMLLTLVVYRQTVEVHARCVVKSENLPGGCI